jgi:lysophospholipase L1-like esterase
VEPLILTSAPFVARRAKRAAMSASKSGGWGRLVILSGASLAGLLLGEVLLSHLKPSIVPYRMLAKTGEPYPATYSDYLPFTLPAGVHFPHATQEFSVVYGINALGYRGTNPRTVEKPPGTKRLLLLGDSFTLGWGNEDRASFAGRLEEALHPRGWEVINAGYKDGYSPDSYYAFLAKEGYALAPDVVAVVVYTANDVSDMTDNQWTARDEEGGPTSVRTLRYFTDTQGRIIRLLHGEVPLRYHLPVLRESRLFVGLLGILAPDPNPLSSEEAMDRLEQVLGLMSSALTRRGNSLLIFLLPDRLNGAAVDWGRTAMHDAIRTRLRARGLPVHDLASVLTNDAYFPHDGHLNPEGHRRVHLEVLRVLDEGVDHPRDPR